MTAEQLLTLIFAEIGDNPPDPSLVDAAEECFAAAVGLLAAIDDPAVRDRVLADHNFRTAEALDAVERDEKARRSLAAQ
jgi:hypothetical protein